jgi:hypothetical protein
LNVVVTPGELAVHAMPTRGDLYLLDEMAGGRVVRWP